MSDPATEPPAVANGISNPSTSPTDTQSPNPSNPKPTTMPGIRKIRLQQMLWHSLMEAKGEVVGVTNTNGDTFSGVLFAIEAADNNTLAHSNNSDHTSENTHTNSDTLHNPDNAAWKCIVLKYVQKMSDPNINPSTRIRAPFMTELKIPASEFASLSAINIIDHTNSYRRSDRQAFNDATGRKMHRKQRELVRWESTHSMDGDELENDDDLDELRNGGYDQFKTNEKFGIKATYDESMYTADLDRTDPEYTKKAKEAQLDEERIMSTATTNKHVADDRAYYNRQYGDVDKDKDEEDMYSRVLHNASASKLSMHKKEKGKKGGYVPPHMRNQGKGGKKNKGNKGNNHRNRPNQNQNNKGKNQNQSQNNNASNNSGHNPQNQKQNNVATQGNTLQLAQLQQAQAQAQAQMSNPLFAGLPPHIAQIVQSVNPAQQNMNAQQQLQYQLLQQQGLVSPTESDNAKDEGNGQDSNTNQNALQTQLNQSNIQNIPEFKPTNVMITNNNGEMEADGSLNPHAIEFTPIGSPNKQSPQNPHSNNNSVVTGVTSPSNITPNASQHSLLSQQQQQALHAQLLAAQQSMGQYNFNPATGQYVLNPFAQQGVSQQQLQLLQQQQQQAYLHQLAIQQQLQLQQGAQIGQPDPSGNITQQQLLAHHQQLAIAQAQQQQLVLAQQAQANGLNIGAPLFTPTTTIGGANGQQQQGINQQLLAQQQAQQQLLAQAQAQAQAQQQQYLQFGNMQQQQQPQFYIQNMQNLMQQ